MREKFLARALWLFSSSLALVRDLFLVTPQIAATQLNSLPAPLVLLIASRGQPAYGLRKDDGL